MDNVMLAQLLRDMQVRRVVVSSAAITNTHQQHGIVYQIRGTKTNTND
jgi:hypothetical protein